MLLLAGCRGADTPAYNTQFIAFDSAVDLSIVGELREQAELAAEEVEHDFRFLDQTLHAWESEPMARVNRLLAEGEPFAAPPSMLPLIRQSQVLALRSDNLFNPAIGHLWELWGFHTDQPECRPPPEAEAIRALVQSAPTMADIYQDGLLLQSDNPAVKLDFRFIATGYAMDLGIETLRARGVGNAVITVGGNVRVIGERAGRPWRIPVRRASGAGVLGMLKVSGDSSVFTRGAYQRNFIYQGQTYHDVIDPRTGYPVQEIHSATVLVDGSAAVADAAATALMVAGLSRWTEVAGRLGIRHALLVDDAGTIHMTPAMAERIALLDDEADVAIAPLPAEEPLQGGSPR
ncbi:FAD:protein FMN transferase [Thiohalocapsa marina]|nr:FAD:protein FMN transferase [Thiohalocapsa marina]